MESSLCDARYRKQSLECELAGMFKTSIESNLLSLQLSIDLARPRLVLPQQGYIWPDRTLIRLINNRLPYLGGNAVPGLRYLAHRVGIAEGAW